MKTHLIHISSWAVFLFIAMLLPTSAFSQYHGEYVALFVNDRSAPPPEVLAKAKQIERRDGVLSVRIVSIGDPSVLIQQKSLLVDLEGKSLLFQITNFRAVGFDNNERKVWSGSSTSGYTLDLMVKPDRLSGRIYNSLSSFRVELIQDQFYALTERLFISSEVGDCDVGEGEEHPEAESGVQMVVNKTSQMSFPTRAQTRILAVYTSDALSAFGSLQTLQDDVDWGIYDTSVAFGSTDAYTTPTIVGYEETTFEEPSSWSTSSSFWSAASADDAEFESLRDDAEADILMLIVDPSGSSCCRGSTRYQLPSTSELSMIYVLADFVDNTLTYTPAHEIGHIFGALHGDGYYLVDSSNYTVYDACQAGQSPGYYDARTIMRTYSYASYDARARAYSSFSDTISFWCPDESSIHTFNLGTINNDTENDYIEEYENFVSNIYEKAIAAKMEEVPPLLGASSFDESTKRKVISYPNPFNPSATIRFSLDEDSQVSLTVYDLLGREIDTLINGRMPVGSHDVTFDGTDLSSGVYSYVLRIHNETNAVEHTGIMSLVR